MAIQLKNTMGAKSQGCKLLVYGESGAGKTWLNRTLENPIILSTEKGLLTLSDVELPFIEVNSISDLAEAYRFLTESEEGKQFSDISLDSITDIAEVCLIEAKKRVKDPRQAYGDLADTMGELIRNFRDIPGRNCVFAAQLDKVQDENGKLLRGPSMPGKNLTQSLPFFFDLVLALRVEKDPDGKPVRALMCETDGLWMAKNRGGRLGMWEDPHLGNIIRKVKGE